MRGNLEDFLVKVGKLGAVFDENVAILAIREVGLAQVSTQMRAGKR